MTHLNTIYHHLTHANALKLHVVHMEAALKAYSRADVKLNKFTTVLPETILEAQHGPNKGALKTTRISKTGFQLNRKLSLQRFNCNTVTSMHLLTNIIVLTSFLHSAAVRTVISGLVGENVILPCFFPSNEKFYHLPINIFWRFKSENIRVHYFFGGTFQRKLQDEKFSERTMLFYEEFPKGNMSLLLKNVQVSDAGIYECSILVDKYEYKYVELNVIEKTYGYTNKSSISTISLPVAILCFLAALCILLRRRKRSRGRTGISSTPSSKSSPSSKSK
ncbi:myelin-oligodendrocyte glycoprotein-like [Mantella aurantiaca]